MSSRAVAAVVTCYNQAGYLEEALASVRAQTLAPSEVVVVDDGSTDASPAVLARQAPPVRVVRQPNRGVSAARNRGLAETRSPYVAFLDADDVWLPAKLERQVAFLEEDREAPAVCAGWRVIGPRGEPLGPGPRDLPPRLDLALFYAGNPIVSPSVVLARRAALEELGGFDEGTPLCGDYDLWLRLARRAPLACLPEALTLYRLHPQSASSLQALRMPEEERRILEKLHAARPLPGLPAGLVRSRLARLDRAVAYNRLLEGRLGEARALLVRSLARRPLRPRTWFYLGFTLFPPGVFRALHRLRRRERALV